MTRNRNRYNRPQNKSRDNYQHYAALAREAKDHLCDIRLAEYYWQHAEHYVRLINEGERV